MNSMLVGPVIAVGEVATVVASVQAAAAVRRVDVAKRSLAENHAAEEDLAALITRGHLAKREAARGPQEGEAHAAPRSHLAHARSGTVKRCARSHARRSAKSPSHAQDLLARAVADHAKKSRNARSLSHAKRARRSARRLSLAAVADQADDHAANLATKRESAATLAPAVFIASETSSEVRTDVVRKYLCLILRK